VVSEAIHCKDILEQQTMAGGFVVLVHFVVLGTERRRLQAVVLLLTWTSMHFCWCLRTWRLREAL
jgi:hypothetical protein